MHRLAGIAAVLALVALVVGCGGGESTDQAESGGVGPLEISARGSDPYKTPGGDNSLQNIGQEADEAELEQAATAAHDYLASRVEKDWEKACEQLTQEHVEEMEQAARSSDKIPGESCADAIGTLAEGFEAFDPMTDKEAFEKSSVDADSLRVYGQKAFLIYRGGSTAYYLPMREEGGAWKVDTLLPMPF
jgi:hypothetical protein